MSKATKEQSMDDAVMELLVGVEKKKEEIKKLKVRPQWKTNCTLGRDDSSPHDRINIQTVRDTNTLISLYAFVSGQESLLTEAAKALGLEYDMTWQASPIEDWKHDLKARAKQLSVQKKEVEIKEMDKRVNKLVSPEQRRTMELKVLQQMLKDS